jgi:hypothetical protein
LVTNSSAALEGVVSCKEADLAISLMATIELSEELGACQPKEQERGFHLQKACAFNLLTADPEDLMTLWFF